MLRDILGDRALLVVVAAPAEARAVLAGLGAPQDKESPPTGAWVLCNPVPGAHMLLTGIGKANAAAGLARVFDVRSHAAVLNIGIGGALPGSPAKLGTLVAATASIYADEGLATPEGFVDCAALGFPLGPFPGSAVRADPALLEVVRAFTDLAGRVATVSTCSGTDALAQQVASRTGAVAEAMEGAAVAHIAARLGVPFVEVRAISNTTGDRAGQVWEIGSALAGIARLIGRLCPPG